MSTNPHRHCLLLCTRRKRPSHRRAAENCDELASLHYLRMHAEFGFKLTPSKQESTTRETGGRCGNVRRKNPARLMSESGQNRNLTKTAACLLSPGADIDR
jgi:hypothetical protein